MLWLCFHSLSMYGPLETIVPASTHLSPAFSITWRGTGKKVQVAASSGK